MKTAMQILINKLNRSIIDNGTVALDGYEMAENDGINRAIGIAEALRDNEEKQMVIEAHTSGIFDEMGVTNEDGIQPESETYYQETFKQ